MADNSQSQLLGLVAFSVVFANEGYQAFGKSDKADSKRALVYDLF